MKIKDLVHPPHIRASNGIIKINATVEAKSTPMIMKCILFTIPNPTTLLVVPFRVNT